MPPLQRSTDSPEAAHLWEAFVPTMAPRAMSGRWLAVALVVLLLPLGLRMQPAQAKQTSQQEDTGLGPVHVVAGSTLTSTLGPVPTVLEFGGQSFDPTERPPTVPGSDGLAVVQFFHGDGHVQLVALEAVEATVRTTWIARAWWFGLLRHCIGARRGPIGPLGGGLRRCVADGCTLR